MIGINLGIRLGMMGGGSSTPPAVTPLTILGATGTVQSWLREDVTITSGVLVDSWNDKSGNGNHFAITGSARPDYAATGGPNSRPSILFDGVDEYLECAGLNLPPPGTTPTYLFWIGRQKTWTNGDRVFSGAATNGMAVFQNTSTPQINLFNGSVVASNTAWTLDTFMRGEALFDNSAGGYLKIASTSVAGNAGNTDAAAGYRIARGALTATTYGHIELCEVVIYTGTAPTNDQRTDLDAYVTERYGSGLV